jgi:hypothetical protein
VKWNVESSRTYKGHLSRQFSYEFRAGEGEESDEGSDEGQEEESEAEGEEESEAGGRCRGGQPLKGVARSNC